MVMAEYERYVAWCKRNGYTEVMCKQEFLALMA
jgi:phage/plasmid-associated DNA primase